MQKRKLGKSNLEVSALGWLHGMSFSTARQRQAGDDLSLRAAVEEASHSSTPRSLRAVLERGTRGEASLPSASSGDRTKSGLTSVPISIPRDDGCAGPEQSARAHQGGRRGSLKRLKIETSTCSISIGLTERGYRRRSWSCKDLIHGARSSTSVFLKQRADDPSRTRSPAAHCSPDEYSLWTRTLKRK